MNGHHGIKDDSPSAPAALEIDDLYLAYKVRGVPRAVLRGVSFSIRPRRGVRTGG